MYSPSLEQVLYIHERLIATSGGSPGVKDAGRLQAALAQPFVTYDGEDLYPGVLPKAVALAYFLIQGHPFHDGNKRIGYAAMLVMLRHNGFRLVADVDEAERTVLGVASSQISHDEFEAWVRSRTQESGG